MSSPHPLPPKKEVALALLERSNDRGIFVHLDPRQPSVVVPPWFKKQPQLVLQIGLNMPVPIPDLRLDEEGMSCTLSFNRSPFYCVVPWASVFAMVGEDGRGMVWPDDVPAEVPLSRQGPQPAPAPPTPMRAVDGAKKGTSSKEKDGKSDGAKAKRPRKRPALAAVPDAEAPAAKKAKAPRAIRGEAAQAGSPRPVVSPAPAQKRAPAQRSAPAASKGKKRELPPYLRVVK
ncbi:MAG TPA: ClpXP protease specificity-enhancing factor SspB [Polyangiaceae bacterium]|jgi:stringent starvation protein B